jgi:AP-4 complex subunit mu-1
MKSFLEGNPPLRLALNEDLVVGRQNSAVVTGMSGLVLDDCNFHECVNLSEFDSSHILTI